MRCPERGTGTPAARRNLLRLGLQGWCNLGAVWWVVDRPSSPGTWGRGAGCGALLQSGWHQACSSAQPGFRHPGREPRPCDATGHRKAQAPVPADPTAGSPERQGLGRSGEAPRFSLLSCSPSFLVKGQPHLEAGLWVSPNPSFVTCHPRLLLPSKEAMSSMWDLSRVLASALLTLTLREQK